jgi:hypothetical protein
MLPFFFSFFAALICPIFVRAAPPEGAVRAEPYRSV